MDLAARGPSAVVRAALLVATACLVTGASSCSRSSDSTSEPTATLTSDPPATTSTTTTIEDVEADVEAAYLAATQAYYEVLESPDPDDARLELHRAGTNLEAVREAVASLQANGEALSYERSGMPRSTVESVVVSGDLTSADVRACTVDWSERVDARSGRVVDGSTGSVRERFDLDLDDGEWRVVDGAIVEEFPGEKRCD